MKDTSWTSFLKAHKTLLLVVVVGFFLMELQIYALASMRSGTQPRTRVFNPAGEMVYELKGAKLTSFDKYYFEKTFGPLDNFQVKVHNLEVPFPFRAWFSAAVGIPVGFVLLLAFVVKVVTTFLQGHIDEKPKGEKSESKISISGAENLLLRVSRFNVFIIGFLIVLGAFLYWVIPNTLAFLAQTGIDAMVEFKWVVIAVGAALFVLFSWFMYMKYQLAKKGLAAEAEIRKYELLLTHERMKQESAALEFSPGEKNARIDYTPTEPE